MLDAVLQPWVLMAVAFVLGATMVWLFRNCQAADAAARAAAGPGGPELRAEATPLAGSAPPPRSVDRAPEIASLERSVFDLEERNRALESQLADARAGAEIAANAAPRAFAGTPDFGSMDESGLKYRAWMLGSRLETVMTDAKAGRAVDWGLAEADLAKAMAIPATFTAVAAAAAPAPAEDDRVPALEAEIEALKRDASAERYQAWRAADREGTDAEGAEANGAETNGSEAGADESAALRAAADTLRARVGMLEGVIASFGGTEAGAALSGGSDDDRIAAAQDDADSLRARLSQAETALRETRAELAAAQNGAAQPVAAPAPASADARIAAAWDDANSLRARLSQAETALRETRGELAAARKATAAPAPVPVPVPAPAPTEDAHALRTENASLRSRLWTSEWRLREMRNAAPAQAPVQAPAALATPVAAPVVADTETAEELKQARAEAATLRSRLWTAEWRLREMAEEAPAAETPAAPAEPEPDARLTAQIETLRERLRRFETAEAAAPAAAAELDELRRERDGLRARLSLSEAEIDRLKAQPQPVSASFAGVVDTLDVDDASVETAEANTAPISLPISGAEAAALELIESDAFDAEGAARPAGLLAGPNDGAPDDLKAIKGVGPKLEQLLNELGVFYFRQIAELSPAEIAWLDRSLDFKGRVVRDRWLPQAQQLAQRKRAGELVMGPDGTWTEPDAATAPLADAGVEAADPAPAPAAAPVAHALDEAALNAIEEEAMRLLEAGYSADGAPRPAALLDAATMGPADDLKNIKGVGPKLEALLNDLGLFYYTQIAQFSASDVAWLDTKLRFNGRIVRDRWVAQAARLAASKSG